MIRILARDTDLQGKVLDQYLPDGERYGLHPSEASPVVGPGLSLLKSCLTPKTRLVSFDVFDTVVTRRSGHPEAEFLFLGQRLRAIGLIQCSAEAFAETRYTCEKRARCNSERAEVSLRDIYAEMTCFLPSDQNIDALIQAELDVEGEAISVIPAMLSVIKQARERFGKVIFISDMYLPQSFLEDKLKTLGCMLPGDRLYLSTTQGVQKGDGRLFNLVLEQEKLTPQELCHVGNSPPYDIAPAKKLGIPHYFFDHGNQHPSEEVLSRFSKGSEGLTAIIAGAARQARLKGLHLTGDQRVAWKTGACVTGPLVYMYAQWIVARAAQKKIKQLYFLARDAYPVYLAVKAILEDCPELEMTPRYIYGSRPTYYALGIEQITNTEWDYLATHGGHRYDTLEAVCAGLMIDSQTLMQHLQGAGLADMPWDAKLSGDQLDTLRRHAVEDPAFNQAILADLQKYQSQQRLYFEQQGLSPQDGVALVDTGWTSRSHAPLFNFLADMGCENLRLLYIGLIVEKPHVPKGRIDTFMFNRTTKQGVMSYRMVYTRALETLFTSFHGRTTCFSEEDGQVRPVFAPLEDPAFIDQYSEYYFHGIRAFLDSIRVSQTTFDPMHNTREVCEQMLRRFWKSPTRAEAQLWSQITWEWDPLGQIRHALSRPYRVRDLAAAFIQGRLPMPYPQFWVAGAKQLTPSYLLFSLRATVKARRAMGRVINILPASVRDPITEFRRKFFSFKHNH